MRVLIALIVLFMALPSANAADSYVVNNGTCETIDEHSECRGVVNNTGASIMVPTKSANEWSTGGSSFIDNTPTGVTLNTCSGGAGTFTAGGFINDQACSGLHGNAIASDPSLLNRTQCAAFCNATPGTTCCWYNIIAVSGSYGNDAQCVASSSTTLVNKPPDLTPPFFNIYSAAQLGTANGGALSGCP